MSHIKTVCRTLFYQILLLFTGLSIGFICNAEWVGWKSNVVAKSFGNIFFPIQFDEDLCVKLKNWGSFKLWSFENRPKDFKIIEDGLLGEEFYVCKFQYKDSKGKTVEKIESVRLRWKPWEYYYEFGETWDEEDIRDYLDNGTLNSRESDIALRLLAEKGKKAINKKF